MKLKMAVLGSALTIGVSVVCNGVCSNQLECAVRIHNLQNSFSCASSSEKIFRTDFHLQNYRGGRSYTET